jgi:hypothetical protein
MSTHALHTRATTPDLDEGAFASLPTQPGFARKAGHPFGANLDPGRLPPVPEEAETAEETLIADTRAFLRPAQMVEGKLLRLMRSGPLPVNQLAQKRCGLSRYRPDPLR